MKWVTRADLGWPATPASSASCNRGIVLHYDGNDQNLANKPHSACIAYWRNTRNFHVNGNGWLDIGYSYGVCPHGYVFTGRGFQRQQAAQPGGNSDYHSITLMGGEHDLLTPLQVRTVNELFGYLTRRGMGSRVKGHRDFISTSCPGSRIYGEIQKGTFKPIKERDEMLDAEDKKWLSTEIRKQVLVALKMDECPAPDVYTDPKNPNWQYANVMRAAVTLSKETKDLVIKVQETLDAEL